MNTFIKRMKFLANILGFLGLTSCAVQPPGEIPSKLAEERATEKQTDVSVLFIGNSYSFGVPQAFRKLSKSRAKNVRIGRSTFGGWTLEQHSTHAGTLRKLRQGGWDIVVIQDHSLHPGSPESEREKVMDPFVKFFTDETRAIGAIPLLYQTWGRRDGDERIPGDDFYAMNDRVRDGYQKAAEHAGGVVIVPAGDSWEREYKADRGRELYHEDGSHPSAYGDKITAKEFYKVIFATERGL